MSDQTENKNATEQTPEISDDAAQQAIDSSVTEKLKVLGVIAAVVIVECGLAYMMIPNATADTQSDTLAVKAAEAGFSAVEEEKTETEEEVEVDLGEFRISSYQPATDTTFRINFCLYGTVSVVDKPEFDDLKQANEARLREQVNVIVRAAEIPDLTDPALGLIKRRILDRINRILGKQLVKGVICSDMMFVEQ